MDLMIWVYLLAILFLLVCSAFFSSAEVAFFSLNPLHVHRIREKHPNAATHIEKVLGAPTQLLSTILIGNTLVNVALPSVTYALATKLIPSNGELVAVALSLILLILFGEIGPKRIAVTYPDALSIAYVSPLRFFLVVLRPLRLLLEYITTGFAPLFHPRGRALSEDEFETVVKESSDEGILEEQELSMVKGIIRLEDLRASDVMTPRVDILGIDLDGNQKTFESMVAAAKVNQLLLYRQQLDNVVGFLDVKRYLLEPQVGRRSSWDTPLFVPEACSLDKLLAQFLDKQIRAAVVVDEYGGTAGIVTRGDILEEITGSLEDEQGGHQIFFEKTNPHRWLMDGQVNLETLSDELGVSFEEEGVDRIAGWITARLERLPTVGDTVEAEGFRFMVRRMRKNRITLVEAVEIQPLTES